MLDALARHGVGIIEVVDVQDRIAGDEGRVRPIAGWLAGPDLHSRLGGNDAEHRVAAEPPGSSQFPAARHRGVAPPALLADDGLVDMATALVGERSRWPGVLGTGKSARALLYVHAGIGHGRLQYGPAPTTLRLCARRSQWLLMITAESADDVAWSEHRTGSTAMSVSWYAGNAAEDGRATRGWLLGHFIDPAEGVRSSTDVEVKWGIHPARDERVSW